MYVFNLVQINCLVNGLHAIVAVSRLRKAINPLRRLAGQYSR